MFWHQPTGAVGFVPGESYLGDEDLDDPGEGDVPPGNEEDDQEDDAGDAPEDEGDGAGESADEEQAGDEPETVELTLDVDEVAPGDEVTLYAEGFDPEEDVEVTLNPTLDVLPVNADGEFAAVVTIPEDTEPGAEQRTGVIAGALLALGAGLVAFANRARLFGRRES